MNEEGYREILGVMLGDSESEASWTEFFSWLKSVCYLTLTLRP
ncbi:Transposase, Mutator family [Alicyclobacillus hesperidum]|uniref:Transposase, Mutator family n=1 Tax=Alicyclobacillus hesperidum TaxID=89784 RepID=A0A1H2YMY5_9BACL|nr:Transposase, Mutator family [Alicyclobacillus hesperidum]